MSSVSDWLALARWPNALMAAAGVLVGARVEQGPGPWRVSWPVLAAMAAAIALTLTANAWNDADDVAVDRVAHPERPLPRGRIAVRSARILAIGAAIGGIALAFLADRSLGLLAIVTAGGMLLYGRVLKPRFLLGNLIVAVFASLPFLFGGVAAGGGARGADLTMLAILLHLPREIAKDLVDAPADGASKRSLPVAFGAAGARVAIVALLLLFAWCAYAIFAFDARMAVAALPTLGVAALAVGQLWRRPEAAPTTLKAAMIVAMATVLALSETGHLAFRPPSDY